MAEEAKWYVVHTYSGYEDKVKANIEKTVENRNISDMIQCVEVPKEDVVEEKSDGTPKVVSRKIFPGYVIIKMVMNDESWYVVRNTRGVTGFVGPGSKPVALSPAEVKKMGVEKVERKSVDFAVGETVMINGGPLEGFTGTVDSINPDLGNMQVKVSMFDRLTPVEVDITQVSHLD